MISAPGRNGRLVARLRHDERVAPLELFFDLVFVLALTQCTAFMADVPTVEGVTQAMLVLAVLWWAWIGYAWLTSVVDPETVLVRVTMAVAMAAFLVAAISVPGAFGGAAVTFAVAYATVRVGQIVLFVLASGDDPELRASVLTLAASTAISTSLLLAAAATDDELQAALWVTAIVIDFAGPYLFGSRGWHLVADHFAERHGLIIIIALGESLVALGAGVIPAADGGLEAGVLLAAVIGTALVVTLWWLYFDVVALVAERRLSLAAPGKEQNELARDAYSYLHLPMVAGIVLIALGLKKSLGDVGDELALVPAAALTGGAALYLLAHVAFRLRTVQRLSTPRLVVAVLLLAAIPLVTEVPALVAVGALTLVLAALVVLESIRFAPLRAQLLAGRHHHHEPHHPHDPAHEQ
jgi:low temperature requirement protein LtrA